jgi:hypothetical protein
MKYAALRGLCPISSVVLSLSRYEEMEQQNTSEKTMVKEGVEGGVGPSSSSFSSSSSSSSSSSYDPSLYTYYPVAPSSQPKSGFVE